MPEFTFVHDLVESNGKTIRENNMERQHSLSVGTLVEVKYDEWHGDGACSKVHARLWIVKCGRDCDGTPLYWLSKWEDPQFALSVHQYVGGFSESLLTPVIITNELLDGYGALEWEEQDAGA